MAYLVTTPPERARGWRRLVLWLVKRRFGGIVPGLAQIIIRDLKVARPVIALYEHLNDPRRSPLSTLEREMIAVVVNGKIGGAPWLGLHTAAVRRLLEDDHVTPEFATLWPTYDLDAKTRALLAYAQKLTETPSLLEASDFAALRTVGWSEQALYEATALIASYNMTGRLEAASGLPLDQIPTTARWLSSLKQEERRHAEGVF